MTVWQHLETVRRDDQLDLVHGEVVFLPKMPVQAIFLIERGSLLVFAPSGMRVTRILSAGNVAGMLDLLAGGIWLGLGVAHGPTRLRAFSAARINEQLDAAPDAHKSLLQSLTQA